MLTADNVLPSPALYCPVAPTRWPSFSQSLPKSLHWRALHILTVFKLQQSSKKQQWKCGPNEVSGISALDFGEDTASPDKAAMKLMLLIHPSGTADEGIVQEVGWNTVDKYNKGWQPLLRFPWYLKARVNFIFQVIKYNYHYLKTHHKHHMNSSGSNQQVISTGLKDHKTKSA